MEISQDLQHRPIVFIRFNPDQYYDKHNKLVKSCWATTKTGILGLGRNKEKEWKKRLDDLKEQINYWSSNQTSKTVEVIQLHYDQN